MNAPGRIVIAGGGIGGLAAALALAATGRSVKVIERREAFSEAGAGIQIGPNGVHVLRGLGVAPHLLPHVGQPAGIVVRDGRTGRTLQRLPLGSWIEARHGAPYWVAHRRDLQAALLTACRATSSIEISTGIEACTVTETAQEIAAIDAAGHRHSGAALIAADGVFSRLRDHVAPGCSARFSGRTAARSVIASELAPKQLEPMSTGVWIAPGAHIVHYPVRQGREIAVVVIRQESWTQNGEMVGAREELPWAGPSWSEPVEASGLETVLRGFAPLLRDFLWQGSDWRRWALFEAPALPRWSSGRMTLLGDAAHPVMPFLAQGGCLALEDAATLAATVAAGGEIPTVLAAYEAARRPRSDRIAAASRRNGQIFHLSGIAATARDAVLRVLPGERVMAQYDWVYSWRAHA